MLKNFDIFYKQIINIIKFFWINFKKLIKEYNGEK